MHLARIAAGAREINLQEERANLAASLEVDDQDGVFVISHAQDEVSFVCKDTMKCTCIASSHEPLCVCIEALRMKGLMPTREDTHQEDLHESAHEEDIDLQVDVQVEDAKAKLVRISEFLSTDNFSNHRNKTKILSNIDALHALIFSTFRKRNTKNKIRQNNPERKAIMKGKSRALSDHDLYCEVPQKKRKVIKKNEDGSFMKCRKKGILRKPFNS